MNKPAPKEPSMDEILSSIRQIIADDDAAVAPRKPAAGAAPATPPPPPVRPVPPVSVSPAPKAAPPEPEPEPLALTPEQILREQAAADAEAEAEAEAASEVSFDDILGAEDAASEEVAEIVDQPPLVDPEDVTFDSDDGPDQAAVRFTVPMEQPAAAPPPSPAPPAQRPPASAVRIPPGAAPSVARAAPMPDPALSSDMAEQLLEPTTEAAVKHAFTRLNGLSMGGAGMTLEELMRDMLRPMLKEWLDENLPAVVERMVEKEIARISRGGE